MAARGAVAARGAGVAAALGVLAGLQVADFNIFCFFFLCHFILLSRFGLLFVVCLPCQ